MASACAQIRVAGRADVLLALCEEGTSVAGVFTRSKCPSAPVDWCKASIRGGRAAALVVNSGNANAFTGKHGRSTTKATARLVSDHVGCRPSEVFLASTGVIGEPPFCANGPALQWERDMAEHKPKPTNTEPGIEYMLAGATDWSATDPHATSGKPITEPPHWMILWPFDPAVTGLPTTLKQDGTWIMYSGTPWAHLMINGRP